MAHHDAVASVRHEWLTKRPNDPELFVLDEQLVDRGEVRERKADVGAQKPLLALALHLPIMAVLAESKNGFVRYPFGSPPTAWSACG